MVVNYSSIDPIIELWCKDNGLNLYRLNQDVQIRSVILNSRNQTKCQIWVDKPDADGNSFVHVCDYSTKKLDIPTSDVDLRRSLDNALEVATKWLGDGHSL